MSWHKNTSKTTSYYNQLMYLKYRTNQNILSSTVWHYRSFPLWGQTIAENFPCLQTFQGAGFSALLKSFIFAILDFNNKTACLLNHSKRVFRHKKLESKYKHIVPLCLDASFLCYVDNINPEI